MSLHDLQQQFRDAVIEQDVSNHLFEEIVPIGTLSKEEAISFYQESYCLKLTQSMLSTFEVSAWVLEEEVFTQYALQYLKKYPSRFYDLNQYGKGFPKFLATKTDVLDSYPFLAELAEFEWLMKEVFDLSRPIKSKSQPKVFSKETILNLDSSLRFYESHYSIYQIWKQKGVDKVELERQDFSKNEYIIIYKSEQGLVFMDSISFSEFEILKKLYEGKTIGQILSHHKELSGQDAERLFKKISQSDFYLGVQAQSSK